MQEQKRTRKKSGGQRRNTRQTQDVDPRWLLKAAILVLLAAFVCGYATFCLLFYQGQWQLVLHPVRAATFPAALGGAPLEMARFGPGASGVPQRTGWWVPAPLDERYGQLVVLFLPSGDGSLGDAIPTLSSLHSLGLTVFAINYRGYGDSASGHPSEQRMRADADAAWDYITQTRHIPGDHVLLYGVGVGASLAVQVASKQPDVPAVILDAPRPHILEQVKADPRVRFLPVRWLLRDRFSLQPELNRLTRPKLILMRPGQDDSEMTEAANPKMTVALTNGDAETYSTAMRRFLDMFLSKSAIAPLDQGPGKPFAP